MPTIHDGVVDGVQVSMRDITQAKRIEKALKESDERYRLLADNVHDIIWTADENMHFTYVSPSVTPFLGITQKEAIENPFGDFLTPESYQELQRKQKEWITSIQKGEHLPKTTEIDLEFKRKDGSTVWTEIMMTMLSDNKKQFIGIVGVTRDISKRRQVEVALRKSNRQLSLLSGITRHDILNKITIITDNLVLLEELITDPEALEYLKKTDSATRTIRSLIDFTRCYDDLGSTQPKWQNLDTIVEQIHFPNHISFYSDLKNCSILADPMLEKVFFNLLDNSIRHGKTVSIIRVSAKKDGDDLIVVWEDNGVGIANDEEEKIFDRGFGKNTGLGIFHVREIFSLTDITIVEMESRGR